MRGFFCQKFNQLTMKKPHITEDEIKGIFWMGLTSLICILIFIGLLFYLFFCQ